MKKKITFHMMFSVFIICTLSCLVKSDIIHKFADGS